MKKYDKKGLEDETEEEINGGLIEKDTIDMAKEAFTEIKDAAKEDIKEWGKKKKEFIKEKKEEVKEKTKSYIEKNPGKTLAVAAAAGAAVGAAIGVGAAKMKEKKKEK